MEPLQHKLPAVIYNRLYHNSFLLNGPMESHDAPLILNSAGCETRASFHTVIPSGRLDYYLIYVIEGKMNFRLEQKNTVLDSGTLLLLPPHYPLDYNSLTPPPIKYLWAHFTGFYAAELLQKYGFEKLPFLHMADINLDVIAKFQNLHETYTKRAPFFEMELANRLESILRTFAVSIAHIREPKASKISTSLQYINENLDEKLTISELAAMEFLSVSRYIAVFNSIMGMPPSRYIIDLRLRTACALLQESNASIKEIGSMVGYDEPHYFCNLFKKHIGMSPGEYREIAKQNLL